MSLRKEFGGINEAYILELYERFRENPDSVDPATRAAFEQYVGQGFSPASEGFSPADAPGPLRGTRPTYDETYDKIVGTVNLAESIRKYGHLGARLDP